MMGLEKIFGTTTASKRIAAEGKAADAFFTANPDMLTQAGYEPEEFKNLGAIDRAGIMKGMLQAQGAQQAQAENAARVQQQQQMAQWLQERGTSMAQQRDEDQFLGRMLSGLDAPGGGQPGGGPAAPALQWPPPGVNDTSGTVPAVLSPDQRPAFSALPADMTGAPGGGPPAPGGGPGGANGLQMTPAIAALIHAGAMAGGSNPRVAASMMRQIIPALVGNGPGAKTFFQQTDTGQELPGAKGWLRVPTGPNTSQLIYAGDDVGVPQAAHDEDGNMIGTSVRDARGRMTFTPFKGGAKMQPAKDADTGDVIPNFYVTPEGKTIDTRSAIQKMTGAPSGAATAPGGAPKGKLTQDQAKGFLKQAGGNKDKARALAAAAGYSF